MKFSKVSILAAMSFAISGLALLPASADPVTVVDSGPTLAARAPGGGCRAGGMMKSLSDEQLEKMNTLKLSFKSDIAPKFAELKTLKDQFRDAVTKPDTSKSDLLALQTKINGVKDEISTARAGFIADRMAVLTDEQKSELRKKFLSRGLMGGRHYGRSFHGKGFHGKSFHGKRGFHRMKGDAGAPDAPVTSDSGAPAAEEDLG
ncbi:MAG: Spy/CpxP family protein refolding chaperone [Candidatus Obscuribacterales bacterium]